MLIGHDALYPNDRVVKQSQIGIDILIIIPIVDGARLAYQRSAVIRRAGAMIPFCGCAKSGADPPTAVVNGMAPFFGVEI